MTDTSNPIYDRRKVRKAMLLAPLASLLGIIPFVLQFNLTSVQSLLVILTAVVVSYILGLLFGAPAYLLLKYLGYPQTKYLMAYAVMLVIAAPILLDDVYAILTFGPSTFLVAGAFCLIRGSARLVDAKD